MNKLRKLIRGIATLFAPTKPGTSITWVNYPAPVGAQMILDHNVKVVGISFAGAGPRTWPANRRLGTPQTLRIDCTES